MAGCCSISTPPDEPSTTFRGQSVEGTSARQGPLRYARTVPHDRQAAAASDDPSSAVDGVLLVWQRATCLTRKRPAAPGAVPKPTAGPPVCWHCSRRYQVSAEDRKETEGGSERKGRRRTGKFSALRDSRNRPSCLSLLSCLALPQGTTSLGVLRACARSSAVRETNA